MSIFVESDRNAKRIISIVPGDSNKEVEVIGFFLDKKESVFRVTLSLPCAAMVFKFLQTCRALQSNSDQEWTNPSGKLKITFLSQSDNCKFQFAEADDSDNTITISLTKFMEALQGTLQDIFLRAQIDKWADEYTE